MSKLKRILAVIAALSMTFAVSGCGGESSEGWLKSGDDVSIAADGVDKTKDKDISGQTIYVDGGWQACL